MTRDGEGAARYVLDANVFIEAARRYYTFELCPGFWDCLISLHDTGHFGSVDRVKAELRRGKDHLAHWAANAVQTTFFASTEGPEVVSCFAGLMQWVHRNAQFLDEAKAEFASAADGWLVAYAKVYGLTVVTHEEYAQDVRRRVKIPNLCRAFDVPYTDTFRMLTELKVTFSWS